MSEKPILFSAPMVRAILDGRKTMTRRVIRPQPTLTQEFPGRDSVWRWKNAQYSECILCDVLPTLCPYGVAGDTLWVRETWAEFIDEFTSPDDHTILYRADNAAMWQPISMRANFNPLNHEHNPKWRPSIHMPRWASRITLKVLDVRVERVAVITEDDARAEGMYRLDPTRHSPHSIMDGDEGLCNATAVECFRWLWDRLNGNRKDKHGKRLPYAWDDNPWVWVVEFEKQ